MSKSLISDLILTRRAAVVAITGFASGLPLLLTGGTLQAWLTVMQLDLSTIGLFSLVGLPYTVKFLWAPLVDGFDLKFIGRRKDWIFLSQILLAAGLFCLGRQVIQSDAVAIIGLLAFLIAFMSATQDIAVDAYRAELLNPEERGFGAGVFVTGYRVAMLVSGAGALILADNIGFHQTYIVMSFIMLVCACLNFFAPDVDQQSTDGGGFNKLFLEPFWSFFSKKGAVALVVIIVLYKLGDAFASALSTTFLIRGLGFSLTDVGAVSKTLGLVASIIGGLYGGVLVYRFGLYRSLFVFAWLQALTNFGFCILAITGASYVGLITVIGLEQLAGGMGTAAFIALLMSVCDRRYTATQMAMLTALASLGGRLAGVPSGYLVEAFGWALFFGFTFVIALPVLYFLTRYRAIIDVYDHSGITK